MNPSHIQWCSAKNIYHGPPVNTIAHMLSLDVNAGLSDAKTCIMATLGPSTMNIDILKMMICSGMRVARLNLSHGNYKKHKYLIDMVRQAESQLQSDLKRPMITIALDTQGPEIRTGVLCEEKPIDLLEGERVCLTFNPVFAYKSDRDHLYISDDRILSTLRQGSRIFINGRRICFEVTSFYGSSVECTVCMGGRLDNKQELIIPGWDMKEIPNFVEKDYKDIEFAIDNNVDVLLLSNVRNVDMVLQAKQLIGNRDIKIIVKIEREVSLSIVDQLLNVSDGLLISRGDLGVEVPLTKLIVIQKNIIARCNVAGKPVICSTYLLRDMEKIHSPSNGEITDIANAIIDGCDGLMLSDVTAVGPYPVKCIQTMSAVVRESEYCVFFDQYFYDIRLFNNPPLNDTLAIAIAAVEACRDLSAKLIITLTTDGQCARNLSKFRPNACILALTYKEKVARYLNLYRSCIPVLLPSDSTFEYDRNHIKSLDLNEETKKIVNFAVGVALFNDFIKHSDPIVMLTSSTNTQGYQDVIHIITEWEDDINDYS
ncbi:hypothetical protein GJ496_005487 [Pomphorhynchus laevis]|nr:hypothetical protein GJ496_005487 [Pomphorhynchus laevis]